MIRLPVSALEPGMVLAAPIPHPVSLNRILLNTGFRFDAQIIRQLRRFAVYYVWIQHPGFDFLDDRMSEAVPRSRFVLYETVKNTFTGVANRTTGAFDLLEYRTVVGNMIFTMVSNRNHAVWAERIMQGERELFGHSANVAYLSLLFGMRLKHYLATEHRYVVGSDAEDLTNLGIGAMFHDLGKLALDPELQRRHVFECSEDATEYRGHPERGYRVLRGRLEATAATVVLNHHQRFDGKGFPVPKKKFRERELHIMEGHRIHVFARVVSVANVLEALIDASQRADRPLISALVSVQQDSFAGTFDPVVLNAALQSIPPFALSSMVELSDGREAVVTDLSTAHPCRPVVHVVDLANRRADEIGEELDLSEPEMPTIVAEGGRPVRSWVDMYEVLYAASQPPAPPVPAPVPADASPVPAPITAQPS